MTNELQSKILKIIIGEAKEDLPQMEYNYVLKALANNYHVEDTCAYIARSLMRLPGRPKSSLQTFFIMRAYEYLVFLNNDHEPSHESERLR